MRKIFMTMLLAAGLGLAANVPTSAQAAGAMVSKPIAAPGQVEQVRHWRRHHRRRHFGLRFGGYPFYGYRHHRRHYYQPYYYRPYSYGYYSPYRRHRWNRYY